MRHSVPAEKLGPTGHLMAEAVQACVHCGFCLPTCPTYGELGQEMDTPRGRILLMKEVLEGGLSLERALPHVDRCLGCLACETSCPSGVKYRNLLGPFREKAESEHRRGLAERLRRSMLLATLPHPRRFRRAVRLGLLVRPMRRFLPKALRTMLDLLPRRLPRADPLPVHSPALGKRRARVALLAGCAQQVIDPEINADTLAVLVRNGVEVEVPQRQGCCGALGWHIGAGERARRHARVNLEAFPDDVDAIVTNAAGCGSGLKEYPLMFKGRPEEAAAEHLTAKVVDVSEFLDNLGVIPPPATREAVRVAYQDACHLRHAQGVIEPPRRLLRAVPGVELLELSDAEICCGSAGSYNLDQPEVAASLGRRKAENILVTKPDWVVSGNVGCIAQLRACLRNLGAEPPVTHLAGLLRRAYDGEL